MAMAASARLRAAILLPRVSSMLAASQQELVRLDARRFDRELTDVFEIQYELTREIV
jgi:TolB-like protein